MRGPHLRTLPYCQAVELDARCAHAILDHCFAVEVAFPAIGLAKQPLARSSVEEMLFDHGQQSLGIGTSEHGQIESGEVEKAA